jgi:hypothetical protein
MGWQGTEVRREEDQGGVVEQRVVTSERQEQMVGLGLRAK